MDAMENLHEKVSSALHDRERALLATLAEARQQVAQLSAEVLTLVSVAERSEERYRALLDNATDGVGIVSKDGIVLDCNRRAEEIQGGTRAQLIGRRFTDVLAPGEEERGSRFFHSVFESGFVRLDGIEIVREDGKRTRLDVSACLVSFGQEQAVMALFRDVTSERRLEEQNRQLQKLEAIGQLTGGVAHDFNNILGTILANSHFLLESLSEDDPRHEDAAEIRKAAERGASLTRQLLAFSRKQVLEPKPIDLNSVVVGVEKMLRRVIGEDIDLRVAAGTELGTVFADRGQIEQVLMNLAVNARDAMPNGGDLCIETCNVDLDAAYATEHTPVQPGRYVKLSIADTGTGMDPETRRRAFEPFFTTKERGRGTGLGLSTCYGIVKQSGGYIWLYSEIGRGTTFAIYLPRHDTPALEDMAPLDLTDLDGDETILLIEDDDSIRAAVSRILTEHGYHVESARDSAEVSAIAAGGLSHLDLVLSDMVIPGGNGPELASQLATRHEAELLFMSGYTDHALVRSGDLPPGVRFLQKPFTPSALLRKVREALDA
jgi:two-component system cell cycle sensor histidine kinase/response regulator CckA